MGDLYRGQRLQIMLTDDELMVLDEWRFSTRMPSRAAAVRNLLNRGLAAEGFDIADRATKSKDFSVVVERKPGDEKSSPKRRTSSKRS